jgi:hypothetical protein
MSRRRLDEQPDIEPVHRRCAYAGTNAPTRPAGTVAHRYRGGSAREQVDGTQTEAACANSSLRLFGRAHPSRTWHEQFPRPFWIAATQVKQFGRTAEPLPLIDVCGHACHVFIRT